MRKHEKGVPAPKIVERVREERRVRELIAAGRRSDYVLVQR